MLFLEWTIVIAILLVASQQFFLRWNDLWEGFESWILERKPEKEISFLPYALLFGLTQGQSLSARFAGLALWNSQVWSKRKSLMLFSFSFLSLLALIILFEILLFEHQSWFMISAVMLSLSILEFLLRRTAKIFLFTLSILAFVAAGWVVTDILFVPTQKLMEVYPSLMALMDSSMDVLIAGAIVSFVVVLIFRAEFVLLPVTVILLSVQLISFPLALAIFLGERLAVLNLILWKSRSLSSEIKNAVSVYFVLTFFAICAAGVLCFFGRTQIDIPFGLNDEAVFYRLNAYLLAILLILSFEFMVGMVWGHFISSIQAETEDVRYFGPDWISSRLLRGQVLQTLLIGLGHRKQNLEIQKGNFGDDWLRVPPSLQARLKYELESMSSLIDRLTR